MHAIINNKLLFIVNEPTTFVKVAKRVNNGDMPCNGD
jgi:hypothetical protein